MRYNRLSFLHIGLITAVLLFFSSGFKSMPVNENDPAKANEFAVVELFTSEGCSSCPAADEALAAISQEYKGNVSVLEFHVDYWNRLGWKDEFSSAAYSERQRKYASALGLDGVYTPQVVINGREEFVGSDVDRLHKSVKQQLAVAGNQSIGITVAAISQHTLEVAYEKAVGSNTMLNIALVQLHATTNVKRGENGGRQLSHINIVRDFKTVMNEKGKVMLSIPAGLTANECKLISYLQDGQTLKILGATETIMK